jgi:5-formyltetrahydrofolate cyclo-ligase
MGQKTQQKDVGAIQPLRVGATVAKHSGDGSDEDTPGSPACFLHELNQDGRVGADRQQARDVARWRKAERARLLAVRLKLTQEYRDTLTERIANSLESLIPSSDGAIVSAYFPIRAEPDLRPWMRAAHARGIRIALPVALAVGQALTFREWHPDVRLARGLWNIPYPAATAEVVPTVLLAPLVGFDPACYRLGYGGGFFDRTLAVIAGAPVVIGVGFPEASIPTIYPQPHDVPMSWIVTGAASAVRANPVRQP